MATDLLHMAAATDNDPGSGDQIKGNAATAFIAMQIVTAGAQAVANMVLDPIPPVDSDDPNIQKQMADAAAKLADLKTKVDTAKTTAKLWLPESRLTSGLCAQLSSIIPHHIIDYGNAYQAASDGIIELLDEARTAGPDDKQNLVSEALDAINYLLQSVQGYKIEMDTAAQRLGDFVTKTQADHDTLVGGSDAIQQLINVDQADIDNLAANIQSLNDEIAAFHKQIVAAAAGGIAGGIFVAVIGVALLASGVGAVAGGAVIAVGVAGVATGATIVGILEKKISDDQAEIGREQGAKTAFQQQIVALTALHQTVANVLDQLTAAQQALSDVSNFWTVFEGTLQSLIDQLNRPTADVTKIFGDKIAVKAAANNWGTLVSFAQQLVSTSVTVTVTPPSTGAAAPQLAAATPSRSRVKRFTYSPGLRPAERLQPIAKGASAA